MIAHFILCKISCSFLSPAPGIEDRLDAAFRFQPSLLEAASETMRKVAEERRERRKKGNKKKGKKKKKKKKSNDEIVFVGVHCRLTDHQVRHSPKSSISRFFTITFSIAGPPEREGHDPAPPQLLPQGDGHVPREVRRGRSRLRLHQR